MSKRNGSLVERGRKLALGACAAFAATGVPSLAGEAQGTINFVQAGHGYTPENVFFLVQVDGTRTNSPSCATDARMAINPATNAGKAMLAMLLSAKAAGQTVILYGTGNCQLMGTEFESISHMRVY
jgi:hypothetical protein